ncbi:hypothetical protein G6011_08120 [Alternaria panax]|uniref:Uncharacterized protein n=1 Tax=Alternaria panax TaxID=48097 RepID=A0AAD4I8E9_9PLEO|nr:hypothetical protein G6011_08120 [Alternaria panax]
MVIITVTMGFRKSRLLAAGAISALISLSLFATRSNVIGDLADAPDLPFMIKQDSIHPEYDTVSKRNYDMRVLTSIRNPVGFYNSIDVENTGPQIMNPTLLELPRGSEHDFLVIARLFVVETEINGVKYQLSRQVAMFANMTYNGAQRPTLTAGKWFKLVAQDYAGPEHHCKHQPHIDKFIGPEDMKLF